MATTRPSSAEEVKNVPYAARSLFRKNPLSIGRRLTVCFLLIVLSMIAAGAVVFWQFRQMVAPIRRLSNSDRAALALVHLRLDVGTFVKNAAALENSHDTEQFSTEAARLRQNFLRNVEDAQQALSKAPEIAQEDPTIPAALETLKVTLPSQLDTAVQLAATGDWNAVQLRFEHQIEDLIDLSSLLVEKMDRQAQQQRTKAIEDAETARRGLFVVLVIAGLLTLILAAALGWYATQSITVPLSELASGAHALARGDLSHQVSVYGNDELAVVGRAFNHATQQLRELYEELLEQASLLNLTHDAIYVRDMKGVIRYWNRGAELLYGWPAEHAVGKVVHELLKAVSSLPFEQIEAELLRTGRWEGELVKTKKDGTQLVVASRWSLKRDDRGEPVAILVTSNDISERKRAEEALRRLNRELRAISNCNQTLLRATDEQSLLEEICRIVCEEAGYRMAWVGYAEQDQAKTVRPIAWAGVDEGYLRTAGISWSEETELGRGPGGTAMRSGKTCYIQDFTTDASLAPWRESALERGYRSTIALPLKAEQGQTFGILTIYSNEPNAFSPEEIRLLEELAADLAFGIVTLRSRIARKEAEEALRESERKYHELVEHANSIILHWQRDGRIVHLNEFGQRFFGYTESEIRGRHVIGTIVPEMESSGRDLNTLMDDLCANPAAFEQNVNENMRRNGEHVWIAWTNKVLLDSKGEVAEILSIGVDITARKRAEEALRTSESYLAEAQKLSHTGSWGWSAATSKYDYWSEETLRIYGFDPKEGLTSEEGLFQRVHPEDRDRWRKSFEKSLREKVDTSDEYRLMLPDGTVKHIHAIRHPVLNDVGDVVRLMGTSIDITARKRAEEALRRTAAYLTETEKLTHTGTWADDLTTKPLYWSEEEFRIWGFDPRGGLPTRDQVLQRIHPEDRDKFWQAFQRGINDKVDANVEFRIMLPDGTVKYAYGQGHPVLNAHGELVELIGTTADITERKRAEEALREGERRFRTFVDHAGDALFVQDLEQETIVDVNRSACDSLGYTREELIGKTPLAFHLDSYQAEMKSITGRAAAGESVFDRHWHRRKDGSTFPVEVHTNLVSYGGRRFLLKVARDITDRKAAEEQRERLRQMEAELAHINRVSMMGELTASIAHEVNQPLSGVVSNASASLRWLAGDAPNLEEAREAARRIVRDGKRAGEVIARIRALTKKASTPREKLDLNETLRQVLALVGDEAKRKSVNIRTQFADDLSAVSGDQVQLQQVVLNLAMNAIEAMSSVGERGRELVITTRNIDSSQVQVTVEDSGVGLDPNTMQKIFEPFYTTKPGGMGMGLSISRSILQAHGGRLWATAKDGAGTIFYFTLPKYQEKESDAGVPAA